MKTEARSVNQAMRKKLRIGTALDVSQCPRDGAYYVLHTFKVDIDYCDARTESWIWSIGRRRSDGAILASLTCDLFENPNFECLWLR